MENTLKIKSLEDSVERIFQSEGDAGLDLRVSGNFIIDLDGEKKEVIQDFYEIKPTERILVKTGVAVAIPKGCWGEIKDRSGNALKYGLHILGGVIDETYRGEIGVILINLGSNVYRVNKNDRIAQMIISEYKSVNVEYVNELDNTTRGQGGFGSTGK